MITRRYFIIVDPGASTIREVFRPLANGAFKGLRRPLLHSYAQSALQKVLGANAFLLLTALHVPGHPDELSVATIATRIAQQSVESAKITTIESQGGSRPSVT